MNNSPHAPHRLRLAVALALFAGTAASAAPTTPASTAPFLDWSSGFTTEIRPSSPQQLRARLSTLAARANESRVLVHLAHPLDAAQRQILAEAGLTLTAPLGGTSYFATLDQAANTAALASAPIAAVSEIRREHKMHPDLLDGILRPWMLDQQDLAKTPQLQRQAQSGMITTDELQQAGIDPSVLVVVMFHDDAPRIAEAQRLAAAHGARVIRHTKAVNAVTMLVAASRIEALAGDDAVMWVEPPLPALGGTNAQNRVLTRVDAVNAAPYNLDGTGVDVLIYDAGIMAGHEDFGPRLTLGLSDTSGTSGHATHVGGTVGGDGSGNYNHRGMAPGVDLVSYGFEVAGGLSEGFLYTDPGDIEADYAEAYNLYGVDIANNSIGSNLESNGYTCAWQGNYGVTSALLDSLVKGAMGSPFRIVWAAGNERQGSRCDIEGHGDFYSMAPPSAAKNHISVGSVDSDTDLSSSFSSWGPTDDGRLKPDISAPGCQVGGDGGVTSTSSFGGYTTYCGTSMAAPTTTGIAALILQQYRATFPDRDDLMNATLKSLLANTAVDRGNIGPDYQYGYGSIRADAAIDAVIAENVVEAEVTQGGVFRAVIIVNAGDTELRVTTAWDDAPAAPNVDITLVNDLDLRVLDAGGNVYMPWTLDPSNPSASAVQSVRDGRNNIEQVAIANPAPGAYTVEITGHNIASGGAQSFGLVSSSTLINCSSAGIVNLGGSHFACSGNSTVQVVDCDLNTSDAVVDTVDVMLDSDSNPGGPLMLTLIETGPESATFIADFSYAATSGSADLLVSEGDAVTASYLDADDGNGNTNVLVTAQATVDCTPAMVSSVGFSDIQPRAATVQVELSEPAAVTVRYGTSPGALNQSISSGAFVSSHEIAISGLTDETTYYLAVEATDRAGNTSEDNNGGGGYDFTTPDIPDFFTEEFTSGLDLEGLSLILTPTDTVDGYEAHILPMAGGVLPFEPTAGSAVFLSDDDSEMVSISGGQQVQLYGQPYSSFYVGSNGYLTFGGSDTDYTESLSDHFSQPRISALFDDLNPSDSGTVYRQQLADRMVVSYDRVTEYSGGNQNTFQIELHFDGTIVMSWERIDSSDAVVGLSAGNGMDPDFLESDLSSYPEPNLCSPDLNDDGLLDFFDLSAFINAFSAQDPQGDMNGDGLFDFFDVSGFINAFTAGCP